MIPTLTCAITLCPQTHNTKHKPQTTKPVCTNHPRTPRADCRTCLLLGQGSNKPETKTPKTKTKKNSKAKHITRLDPPQSYFPQASPLPKNLTVRIPEEMLRHVFKNLPAGHKDRRKVQRYLDRRDEHGDVVDDYAHGKVGAWGRMFNGQSLQRANKKVCNALLGLTFDNMCGFQCCYRLLNERILLQCIYS